MSNDDYKKNVVCYACGQKGHYANDPVCPKFGKGDSRPALRMAHVVGDGSSETDVPAHEEG